jgi:hypothetical protein
MCKSTNLPSWRFDGQRTDFASWRRLSLITVAAKPFIPSNYIPTQPNPLYLSPSWSSGSWARDSFCKSHCANSRK